MQSLDLRRILLIVTVIIQISWPSASLPNSRFSDNRNGVAGYSNGPCPERCKCKPRAVYCDGTKMEVVPRRLPRNIATLRMKGNRIRSLHYDSFRRMFDLRHLIFTGNKVSYIESTTFKDMYSLISLSLSQNELVRLSEDTFKHQLLLKELSLSRNRLRSVELVLSYLENVQVLNLAENQLETITERTFQGNVAVRVLDLHKNRIHHIHRRAFRRLVSLTFLVLRENPLVEVYAQFHANHMLEQLDITRCKLTSVMKDMPPGLRDLRLSENNIEHVDSNDFQNPSSIELLVLSYNAIEVLSDAALEQMTALYELHLTQNRLPQLPNSLPVSLHGLYASYNRIRRIGKKSLSTQQRLNSLVLSHNLISDIDPEALRNLKRLVSLDLSYNEIQVLRASVFKRLYSLQRLDLSNNPLFQIEPGCFVGLENLHILKMSSVEGSDRTKTSSFADLTNLLFLDLSNSSRLAQKLTERGEYAMQAFESVEDLNVMNTGLRGLPSSLRLNLPFLRIAKLTGNPWHCDTNIGWLSQWMRSGNVEFYEPDQMLCSSPQRLKGRRIVELTWNDLAKATALPSVRKETTAAAKKIKTTTASSSSAVVPFKRFTTKMTKASRSTAVKITTPTTNTTSAPTTTTTISTTRHINIPYITTTSATTTTKTSTLAIAKTTTPTTTTEISLMTTSTPAMTTTSQTSARTLTMAAPTSRVPGVFLQFKRVRPGEGRVTSMVYHGNIPVFPQYPTRLPSRLSQLDSTHVPSEEYFALRIPRYSLFRLNNHEYMNDEESSTPDDYEDFVLSVSHYNDEYDDKKGSGSDEKHDELDNDNEIDGGKLSQYIKTEAETVK